MKKIIFVACLLFPLGLFLYGKLSPLMQEAKEVKQVTDVVRQIPLNGNDALKDAFKQLPTTPAPKATPVKPKATPVPKPRPKAPSCTVAAPRGIHPPQVEPEKQPTEFCALGWLSVHCGFAAQ